MGGLIGAALISVTGAMIAVIAGYGLLVAAIARVRRVHAGDYDFAAGYNALPPQIER
jgi:hypothetical protein